MKRSLLGLSKFGACALMGGIVAFAGDASAIQTNMSAAGCGMVKNGVWGGVSNPYLLTRTNDGVSNPDTSPHDITCPVARSPAFNGNGVDFYIDYYNNGGAAITCTLYSYNNGTGGLDGSTSFTSSTAMGIGQAFLHLTGAQTTPNNYLDLKCTLGSTGANRLRGYTLEEF